MRGLRKALYPNNMASRGVGVDLMDPSGELYDRAMSIWLTDSP